MEPTAKPKVSVLRVELETLQAKLALAEANAQIASEEAALLESLHRWEAPNRLFKERSRGYYVGISLIAVLVIAFGALAREILLIFVTIGVLVLLYVSSTVKPRIIQHEITNKGIRSGSQLYTWKNILGFWTSRRDGQLLLIVDLVQTFTPNRVILLMGSGDPRTIVKTLIRHSAYLNQKQASVDIVNVFTVGEYLPITAWVEKQVEKQVEKRVEK